MIRPKILKRPQHQQQLPQPQLDLKKLEAQIEAEAFPSVLKFHLELRNILNNNCPLPKCIKRKWINEFLNQYKIIAMGVFPGFDPYQPLNHFEAIEAYLVQQPSVDHRYIFKYIK